MSNDEDFDIGELLVNPILSSQDFADEFDDTKTNHEEEDSVHR